MSAVDDAKRGMAELGTKAQRVLADDSLSLAEKKNRLDAYQADLKSYSETISLHEQAKRLVSGADVAPEEKAVDAPVQHRSLGGQVVNSAAYKSLITGQSKAASVDIKAATTIDEGIIPAFSGGAGIGGQLVAPQFLPGIVPLKFQPLTIADLLAQGTTTSSSISYVIESAFQDLTATVAEKGTKPQLDLTLARRQDNVTKIANVAKVTDEMFQDAAEFESYLSNRMIFGIQRVEEAQILNGSGTTPNLQGILNRSGLASTVTTTASLTAQKAVEGIFNQITALRATSFVEPDAIVIHPTDWQTIRLGKDSNQQYYAGGPFTGAYGNPGPANVANLWGIKVVITTAITQGTVLVGAFQESGQVFRRQGITLEMTNSNVDDFVNNLITLRAEERLALAIYRPAGFGKVVLTA
jgi:HK97 family phage major capsid protein